jgi:hypothetical protein
VYGWGGVLVRVCDNGIDHFGVYDNGYVLPYGRDDDDFLDDCDDDVDFFDVRLLRVRLGLDSATVLIVGKGVDSFLIIAISISLVCFVQPLERTNDLKYFSASADALEKSSLTV